MSSRRALARRLAAVEPFSDPRLDLEQYPTPPDVAAHLLHLADLQGDLTGTVLDLGAGTGALALAAACRDPDHVVGVELDGDALATARANERRVAPETAVDWVRGDVRALPVAPSSETTVVANPPFGAQDGAAGADRPFLAAAADLAETSYTLHNAGSRAFVESFAGERGGEVTHAFAVAFDVDRQFAFHDEDRRTLSVEAFRIDWR
jgi:putative methylase